MARKAINIITFCWVIALLIIRIVNNQIIFGGGVLTQLYAARYRPAARSPFQQIDPKPETS